MREGGRRAAVLLGAVTAALACAGPAHAVKPAPGPSGTPYRGNPHSSPTPSPAATSSPGATASPAPVRTTATPAPATATTAAAGRTTTRVTSTSALTAPRTSALTPSASTRGPRTTARNAVEVTTALPRTAPTPAPPTTEEARVLITGRHDLAYAPEAARRIAAATAHDPQLPLSVLLVVLLFLLVQNRIDRKDPKLAEAGAEHEVELAFGPVAR